MSEHRRHPDPSDPPSDIDAAAIASPASPTIAPAAPLIDTPARVLTHVLCSTLAQATFSATVFILPVIARKHFQAERWQVLIITMAPLVLATSSIFWGALLRRTSIRRYLLTYWAIAGVPLIGLAFVQSYWPLAILYIISSLGSAAWAAVNGELLNRLYPEGRRGRAYAYLSIGITAGGAALGLLVGKLLEHNPESFRWYIPALIILQLLGVLLLGLLAAPIERLRTRATERWSLRTSLEPISHMREVLASDRVFLRYEAAFMTYGVGWMICWALLPLLVTDKLALDYDQIARSTHVATLVATLVMTMPFGLLSDRIGPIRTSALAFAFYALYPLMLIWASDTFELSVASIVFGICSAGASVGWLMGPVTLAPSADKVPQYVAIHATLVGLRGSIFQGLGVGLYALTGSFTPALIIAAIGFAWASQQMLALHRLIAPRLATLPPDTQPPATPPSTKPPSAIQP